MGAETSLRYGLSDPKPIPAGEGVTLTFRAERSFLLRSLEFSPALRAAAVVHGLRVGHVEHLLGHIPADIFMKLFDGPGFSPPIAVAAGELVRLSLFNDGAEPLELVTGNPFVPEPIWLLGEPL